MSETANGCTCFYLEPGDRATAVSCPVHGMPQYRAKPETASQVCNGKCRPYVGGDDSDTYYDPKCPKHGNTAVDFLQVCTCGQTCPIHDQQPTTTTTAIPAAATPAVGWDSVCYCTDTEISPSCMMVRHREDWWYKRVQDAETRLAAEIERREVAERERDIWINDTLKAANARLASETAKAERWKSRAKKLVAELHEVLGADVGTDVVETVRMLVSITDSYRDDLKAETERREAAERELAINYARSETPGFIDDLLARITGLESELAAANLALRGLEQVVESQAERLEEGSTR